MGKLLRIRATSETIAPTAPSWSAMPSPTILAGIAGSYVLPVANATSITWAGSVAKPAWLTIVTTTPLSISWTSAATAGTVDANCELLATGPGGSVPSGKFPLTVQTVSTEVWGPEYDYSAANWRLYRRDYATRYTAGEGVGHDVAQYNFPLCKAKDSDAVYRPTNGRIYTYGGDQAMWSMNFEGFTTSANKSNNNICSSFSVTSNPTWIAREAGYPNSQSEMYGQMDDKQALMHDSVNDRLLWFCNSTFGNEWAEDSTYIYGNPIIAPVTLVNSTTARFASTTTAVPVGTKLKFLMTVGANSNVFKRGRVTSVTDVGGGQIEVVLNWWDTLVSFQNPSGVVVSRSDTDFAPRHGTPTGAWQEASIQGGAEYYNESTGKWYGAMLAMDYSTRLVSRLLFEMPGRGQGFQTYCAQFLPASATGRGAEVWAAGGGTDLDAVTKYDLATMTATQYSTGGAFSPQATFGYMTRTNKACNDGRGNIYFFCPNAPAPQRIGIVNVRGATPTFSSKAVDYPTKLVAGPGFLYASYRMVWNEEIQRIELYCMETEGTVVDGNCAIFLIDPSTTPAKVERIGDKDANGRNISGSTVVHVPTIGSSPAHTWMMSGDAVAAPEACSRTRIFIAANRRKWEGLSAGSHWYHSFTEFNPKATDAVSTFTQVAAVPAPWFGNWVPEIDSSGLHTGKVYIRAGGDGDYGGNEVTILRLDQLSGTTFPTQLNTVTGSGDFAQWHNRIRTGFQGSGTTGAREILVNPANLSEWAPVSIHTQYLNSFVPGYGYVEDWISPNTIGGGTHTRAEYAAASGFTYTPLLDNGYPQINWGDSYGMAQQVTSPASGNTVVESLNFWSELGANAGKWQRAVKNTGIQGGKRLAEFNTDRNVLLGFKSGSGNMATVYEWTPGAGSFVKIRDIYENQVVGNDFAGVFEMAGNNEAAITWVSGDTYLVRRQRSGRCGFITYVRGGAVTRNKGANGNAICDAADAISAGVIACPDRARGQVLWIVGQGSDSANRTIKLYRSPISDLWNWREMYVANSSEILLPGSAVLGMDGSVGIKPAFVAGDYLWLGTNVGQSKYGPSSDIDALKVWRIPIY